MGAPRRISQRSLATAVALSCIAAFVDASPVQAAESCSVDSQSTFTDCWSQVDANVTITISNDISLNARVPSSNGKRRTINLNGRTLTASNGIQVVIGDELVINDSTGSGELTASTSTDGHSGIGGNRVNDQASPGESAGTITVNSGTVNAQGGTNGSGIGGGQASGPGSTGGAGATLIINGGSVIARNGGGSASGVGGGRGVLNGGAGGTLIINNGSLTTQSISSNTAGIGGGPGGSGGTGGTGPNLTVNCGTITATGGSGGVGIGGGAGSNAGNGGTLSIRSGVVTASGTGNATGIGGGAEP